MYSRFLILAASLITILLSIRGAAQTQAHQVHPTAPKKPQLTESQRERNLESFDYVWTTIRDKYFDPTLGGLDWEKTKVDLRPRIKAAGSMSEARAVLGEMISRLKVSHFSIIPQEVYRDLEQLDKPRGGVAGIDVRVVKGRVLVTSVRPESPAANLGIQRGWEIVRIGADDVPSKLKSLQDKLKSDPHMRTLLVGAVQSRLRGRIGAKVELVFLDGSDQEVETSVSLVAPKGRKARFGHIPEFHIWIDVKELEHNLGYISFNAFMDPVYVMSTFNDAMRSFDHADGIIIDVRGNGGGMGEMGMGMIGWLVDEPQRHLGTIIFRDHQLKMLVSARPHPFQGPVAVLVDEMSVSAAEFFASGLKDLDRVKLFGTRTAGAVLGSSIERLPNGDGFQYAAVNYISKTTGRPLEGIGVTPDVGVVHTREALLQGRDQQLEAAVKWIRAQKS